MCGLPIRPGQLSIFSASIYLGDGCERETGLLTYVQRHSGLGRNGDGRCDRLELQDASFGECHVGVSTTATWGDITRLARKLVTPSS